MGDIPPVFPDTTLPSQRPDNKKTRLFGYVPPNISLWSVETKTAWGDLFKKMPKDTLSIYIFNADTLSKYSWEEIRNGYKVLRRYDISIQDVEKRSYKIVYP